MRDESKKKRMDKKWENLEKLGISRPKDATENAARARMAHIDPAVIQPDPK